MRLRLRRMAAIVKADVLIRFRRLSTLIVFLLLSSFVYVWVPDPATGSALLVVDDGRRALYNSAAMGLATAMLATFFVGLAGFYATSNAIRRDVESRCGFILASTTLSSAEYLVGKLCGNIAFLVVFTGGFLASSMAMLVVRNEAPLEPWVFVKQYILLVPPAIVLAAVLAIVFESVSFLSGRIGDVLYFVIWLSCFSFVVALLANGLDPGPARYLDFGGLGFVFEQMRPMMRTPNLSLGGGFDPAKPLFVFHGLRLDRAWLLPRLGSLLLPLPLLAIALRAFHRFDPERVRSGGGRERRNWIAGLNAACKPLARILPAFPGPASSKPSLLRAAAADARLTMTAYPVVLLAALILAVASLANTTDGVLRGVLPAAFALAGLLIADVPCRERRAGTLGLIYPVPVLKARFVGWKLLAAAFVAVALLAVPLARVALTSPASLAAVAVGLFFVVSAATSLGVISGTPKTFVVVFLTFLYVVVNAKGSSPALDFAGFYGAATPAVTLAYAAAGAAFLAAAQAIHAMRLRRDL